MHRSFNEIQEAMKEVDSLPIKPDFKRPKDGDVIDENKSVVWNQEEVASLQMTYDDERSRLVSAKNKRESNLKRELYEAIIDEVGGGITQADAATIYQYAYDEGHAYGYHDVFCNLESLMVLVGDIVNHRNK